MLNLGVLLGVQAVSISNPEVGSGPVNVFIRGNCASRTATSSSKPLNVTRAAVPHMRKQRSGCVLQISSVGGRLTRPGSTPYHAAKWDVRGFTESLAQELSPFGVKVCALERGGMRTNWGARANQDTPELLPDYEPSVGAVAKALKSYWGKEVSYPVKVAQVVLCL